MAEGVTAFAPGSASNLGPGFDCLGMALSGRGDRVTARLAPGAGVRVVAVSDPRIPLEAGRNTAAIAAAATLRRAGSTAALDLTIEKGLPLAGGLGGSAASAVAGAVAADAVIGSGLAREALLEAALEAESVVAGRHADNVAPSLFGGLVLILGLEPPRLVFGSVHQSLAFVVSTPSYGVETLKARSVLPPEIPRNDAVAQAAHLGGLLLALERGDGALIGHAMEDRIAHPFRAVLYPGYAEAHDAALGAGAHGVAVSGAGPTLLAVVPRGEQGKVARAIEEAYRRAGFEAESHEAEVDRQGARVVA
ncbi:MAG: homoserine kinase [Vicinamibacteria bacterium]